MNNVGVAVVSYEDPEFQNTVGGFLADHFSIAPVYLDVLTREILTRQNLDIFLVNSDALNSRKNYLQSLRAAAKNCAAPNKSIFMLTRSLKASQYLRNQELKAEDTIDIGSGLGGLKIALARRLLERQLSLFAADSGRRGVIK